MPADMSKYPKNWNSEIRPRILQRAGGELPDARIGARCEWCDAENWKPHPKTGSKVILTIAHLDDPNPMNVTDGNLAALCQKCHNGFDAEMRAQNRMKKRRVAQIEAGQMEMTLL